MPSQPRRAAIADGPTPCSAYVLERRLTRAYEALYQQQVGHLWHPATRRAAQVAALGGLDRAATRNGYAEARLTEALPELITRLTLEQQPALSALLLGPDGKLSADAVLADVVAQLVKFERNLNYRDEDARLSDHSSEWQLKVAGMGAISRSEYGTRPLGEPLQLTPWTPPRKPTLRTKAKPGGRVRRGTYCKRTLTRWPQLSLEFPGGTVTVASL